MGVAIRGALALGLVVILARTSTAQEGRPQRPPEFVSPEVKADGSVTLRVFAPQAKAVRLAGGDLPKPNPFGPGPELKKAENGVWEVTVEKVRPGAYRYKFNMDGLEVADPKNPAASESLDTSWSLFTVPGSPVADLKEVPHGAVAAVPYFSKSLKKFRRMHVYTPPGYEKDAKTYPVFYLLHGATDSDASWGTVGKAGQVLDNLIAAGKAKPMIVVMPMGHTGPFRFGGGGNSFQTQMEEFDRDFQQDIRPLVESTYRVSPGRENRAIAGLSMGGAQTLNAAIPHLKDYAYVGVFSSGIFGIDLPNPANGPSFEETHKAALDDADAKKGLKLLWFATGKDDFLLNTTRATVKMLESHGFKVVNKETEGGHTWIVWRELYLPEFAQALFQ